MIAFNERAYGEMTLHPPPLSYFSALLVPFAMCSNVIPSISKGFSYFMFWLENILFLLAFFIFELMMFPIAYIKVWYNILKNSTGISKMLGYSIVWILIGIILMFFIILNDCGNVFNILMQH